MAAGRPYEDMEDGLRRIRDGDHQAFNALVVAYWEPVMRFCWKRMSAADAEDLTQEVFVSAYQAVLRGRGPDVCDHDGWRRYLLVSARAKIIDRWRRMGIRPPAKELGDLLGDELTPPKPGGEDTGLGRLIPQELSIAIRDCLDRLDVLSRAMCWLVFVEDRSKREVGRLLGKPESSVRNVLANALTVLRPCLDGKGMAPNA